MVSPKGPEKASPGHKKPAKDCTKHPQDAPKSDQITSKASPRRPQGLPKRARNPKTKFQNSICWCHRNFCWCHREFWWCHRKFLLGPAQALRLESRWPAKLHLRNEPATCDTHGRANAGADGNVDCQTNEGNGNLHRRSLLR